MSESKKWFVIEHIDGIPQSEFHLFATDLESLAGSTLGVQWSINVHGPDVVKFKTATDAARWIARRVKAMGSSYLIDDQNPRWHISEWIESPVITREV